jgi:hypothetical protein
MMRKILLIAAIAALTTSPALAIHLYPTPVEAAKHCKSHLGGKIAYNRIPSAEDFW